MDIFQSGGTFIVSNLFSFAGYAGKYDWYSTHRDARFVRYEFSSGTLYASNIELLAHWIIGSSTNAGRITNPGYFKLAGTLEVGNAVEQLGRFILASNAVIDLGNGNAKLSFANSRAETWNGAAILLVTNWGGLPGGGGDDQLKFGNDASGLTALQLSQIRFINPNGFAPGTYLAQMLATGEVVPVPRPSLSFSRTGTNLVFTWAGGFGLQTATNVNGPYEDVTAASPYTNNFRQTPERYFRLWH